jgi:glycosyltransferase involved in cell wall biosynthesis
VSTNGLGVTLCSALAEGGIAQYSYSLAGALQAGGANVTQLMFGWPEYELRGYPHMHRVVRRLRVAHSRWTRLTTPMHNLGVMVKAAAKSQVMHFQWSLGERTDRLHMPVLRRLGKGIVYTAHDVLPHESDLMSEAHARWLYSYPDALFVHGDALKAQLVGRFDVDPARVHVVPLGNFNFIADTPGAWDRTSARASLGFRGDELVVLFFGLIREYKGLDTLLRACGQLRQRWQGSGRKLRLVVAGRAFRNHWDEGGYDSIIREAGLGDMISLHLRNIAMDEVARFFRCADVVAVPYKRGSQSGVLRLAYAFGLPSVATSVGSLAEVAGHDVARFVPADDPEGFANALEQLLADHSMAQSMGERARRYADEDLAWERIAATTRTVYEGVLGTRR